MAITVGRLGWQNRLGLMVALSGDGFLALYRFLRQLRQR